MTPQQEKERGIEARRILESPLMQEAFSLLRLHLEELRDDTKWNETELRESVHFQLRLLKDLREYFEAIIRTGDVAQKELLKRENRKYR